MRPASSPRDAVATSLPLRRLSEELADTALLPSTAPALRAKLTAATPVPVIANTSAITETTIDGEGVLTFTSPPPPVRVSTPPLQNPAEAFEVAVATSVR